jgi:hypothetical protein
MRLFSLFLDRSKQISRKDLQLGQNRLLPDQYLYLTFMIIFPIYSTPEAGGE